MQPFAIIQARMSSTRLPGKVLMELAGRRVLDYVIDRCRRSHRRAGVLVATTTQPEDDCIAAYAQARGIGVFRGSRDDVLERYVQAAQTVAADPIVRITSDCPLVEPAIIDRVVDEYVASKVDFVYPTGYPRGTGDTELLSFAALQRAYVETGRDETYYREHVLTYHLDHLEKFTHREVVAPNAVRHAARLCVDEPADLAVVRAICGHFAPRMDFTLAEVLGFLEEHPEIAAINREVRQKTQ